MKMQNAAHTTESTSYYRFSFFSSFLRTSGAVLKYFEYQLTKCCLEGRFEGFNYVSLWFLKIMWLVEYQIAKKCHSFHDGCIIIIHKVV